MNVLTEKELTIIDRIGDNGGLITQRQIAQHTGFSLGLTNIILKKLAKTGYIKIKQLTSKKIHYILTPKGISEKAEKSYRYIFRTIGEIKNIKNIARDLILGEYKNGARAFGVLGDNEIADMVEISIKDVLDIAIRRLGNEYKSDDYKEIDVVLDCRSDLNDLKTENCVSQLKNVRLIDYIIKRGGHNGREGNLSA